MLAVVAMPKDANPAGSAFGGWLLAQFDLAGAMVARQHLDGEYTGLVTKAVNQVDFMFPIGIGDRVNFYGQLKHKGNTSLVIEMLAEAERYNNKGTDLVAYAEFVYVRTKPQ